MNRLQDLVFIVFIFFFIAACNKNSHKPQRPLDPWAFRSNLDKQPRMLTLALDPECNVAYDLAHCTLYKVWKGGVTLEGAVYTSKKNVQPTTWGRSYFSDSIRPFQWIAEINGRKDSFQIINKGYVFRDNQIYLKFLLIPSSKDTIHIEERPEFIRDETGNPALERTFKTSGVKDDITISIKSRDTVFKLKANNTCRFVSNFNSLPMQYHPDQQEEYDHRGRYYMEKSD